MRDQRNILLLNALMKGLLPALMRKASYVLLFVTVLFLLADNSSAEINGLLLSALHSKDNQTRLSAIEKIGEMRDDEATTVLMEIAGTKEEDWRIKIRAIRLLGEIGDSRSTDLLLNIFGNPFLNETCPSIKWNTALALGHFKNDTRVVEALIKALHYSDLMVREAAIQSLGKIGNPYAVAFIVPALKDKSFAIRRSAVEALSRIGSSEAVPFLKKVSETDNDPFIKSEALSALKALKQS